MTRCALTVRQGLRAGAVGALLTLLPAAAAAEPLRIVALGDSNTHGHLVDRAGTYPAQMEATLRARGHDVVIVNAGENSDMASEAASRLDQAVPDGTDAAIVFLGRNDWRKGTPEVTIGHHLDSIVARLRARGIEVLLVGFAPLDFSAIAERHDALYYPNFFAGITTFGRKRGRYVVDGDLGRHLNAEGYAVVARRMLPSVVALIEKASDNAAQ